MGRAPTTPTRFQPLVLRPCVNSRIAHVKNDYGIYRGSTQCKHASHMVISKLMLSTVRKTQADPFPCKLPASRHKWNLIQDIHFPDYRLPAQAMGKAFDAAADEVPVVDVTLVLVCKPAVSGRYSVMTA